jgi:transposase-like protein
MYSDWYMAAIVEVQRRARGQAISKLDDQIERLDGLTYKVLSQSGNGSYIVKFSTLKDWSCSCPDHVYRDVKCKHIWAVEFSLRIRDKVQENVVIQPIVIDACLYCKSKAIFKDGLRHNKYGDIQKWNCRSCGRYFTINIGFERMKHNPQGITTAMQLYFAGESLRNVTRLLRLIGVEVSYQTVWNWIQKYTALMEKYLERITPQVSDTWRADELFLKVHGNMKYLYALMDDQTRFWIAQEIAHSKFTADVRPLFAN